MKNCFIIPIIYRFFRIPIRSSNEWTLRDEKSLFLSAIKWSFSSCELPDLSCVIESDD